MAQHGRSFVIAEYNVENMFDARHDTLKNDYDFTPDGKNRWTRSRCWRKVNAVARGIVSIAEYSDGAKALSFRPADVVALCEVENDSVMDLLTHRSLIRTLGYEYIMTHSPDPRGIDVAMMYNPASFRPFRHYPLRITDEDGKYKTRDILYCAGEVIARDVDRGVDSAGSGVSCDVPCDVPHDVAGDPVTTVVDTLHFFVVHAPSRRGGEYVSRGARLAVVRRLLTSVDSLFAVNPDTHVIVLGDFNDYSSDRSIQTLLSHGFREPPQQLPPLPRQQQFSRKPQQQLSSQPPLSQPPSLSSSQSFSSFLCVDDSWHKIYYSVGGTYKFWGEWGSLDHILVSSSLSVPCTDIIANNLLLEYDTPFGGVKPRRFLLGSSEHHGFSDHLPLRMTIAY